MDSDLVYKIALSMVPGITADVVRTISARGISFEDFFTLDMQELSSVLGMQRCRFQNMDRQEALFRSREEAEFVTRHSISALFLLDENYPCLLREAQDAPVVLYKLGNANLDASPSIAVVGTRKCTHYGTNFCKSLIDDLLPYYPNALIVSGLAYGIDAAAHNAALDAGMPTVAVMAHGLDYIYPAQHRDLARRIVASGGAIVSEYPSKTRPFQRNFLQRNRIVAALTELTFVVESEVKGGAMSTANQAFCYNREVVALPGRWSDTTSSGCNSLISRNKAHIYTTVADLMRMMGWKITTLGIMPPQKNLFPELEGDNAKVYDILRQKSMPVSIDEIHVATGLPVSSLMTALTELEFDGIIVKLPGARYECC